MPFEENMFLWEGNMEREKMIEKLLDEAKLEEASKMINLIKKNRFYYFYYKAEILRMKGIIKKALILFKKSFTLASSDDEKLKSLLKIASLSRTVGDLKTAERSIILAKKISPQSADVLMENAMYLRLAERYNKALKIFNRLKKMYFKKNDISAISYIMWAEGGIYRNIGDIKKSVEKFKEALRYAKMAKDLSLEIYCELGLAGCLRIMGKINESYLTYSRCIKKIPQDDFFGKGYSYCGTANALRQLGRYKTALEYYKKALYYYNKTDDKADIALVLWGMAECYKKIDLKKAYFYINKAKRLIKNIHEIRGSILIKLTESHIRYARGEREKAKKLFNEAFELSKKHKLNTLIETFG